ncbi:hypothetical protein HXX76_010288 [Chlamydomonas incerta]|uniref:BTB domain-containing protein n=1 Tax=Chlamydomonas incerta TaxID=51695 RepID=A0A835SXQ6_CHLIN|nr:hypothetical protein HXX76_010288 [Chlamydomonas incerta]|eukprot:KAG2430189.1 hypothetical protein HXX76_010288 [Chlamydomonas incerta]
MATAAKTLQDYFASVYGTEEAADCRLRFYVLHRHTEQVADGASSSTDTGTSAQLGRTFVGEPLPAHSLILRGTSLRLRALLSRWTGDSDRPWLGASGVLPELHVLLDAAEDLGPAAEVVRFCYTGQLPPGGFHQLLLLRRQASYLQVPTCVAACDHTLEAIAKDLVKQENPEFMFAAISLHSLFPDPGLEPGFRPVQQALTAALLAHFGCAFATMSSWARLQQWMRLPEVAVAWVLASEELMTDEESSVLLLLLWWLHWQQHEAGALGWEEAGAAGRRLVQHVRLGCLSRPFLLVLLPQLDWLQLTPAQYAAVVALGTAGGVERSCGVWTLAGDSGDSSSGGSGSPQGAEAWYRGPRKQGQAMSRPITSVRHFSRADVNKVVRVTTFLTDAVLLTAISAAPAGGAQVPPWHHASGNGLWCAVQPHKVHCDPMSSPWAGGAIYQGGFFFGLELARRLNVQRGQPTTASEREELRLCVAAYEALPPGLRGCMQQRAFASVDARVSVKRVGPATATAPGVLSGMIGVGVPLPVRDWWSHDFQYAAKAVTAVVLPHHGSASSAEPWKAYMTTTSHGSFMACELALRPRLQADAAAQPPAPVSAQTYARMVLAGVALPPEDGAWEWDMVEADTESELTDDEAGEDERMPEAAASGSDMDGGDADWTPRMAAGGSRGGRGAGGRAVAMGLDEVEEELEEGSFRAVVMELLRRDGEAEMQGSSSDEEEEDEEDVLEEDVLE